MVVELQECRIHKDANALLTEANVGLEKQVALLERIVELKSEEVAVAEKNVEQQKELLKTQEELCEKTKPTFWDGVKKAALWILIGLGIGLLL